MFDTQSVLKHFGIDEIATGGYVPGLGWLPTEGRAAFDAICPADGKVVARVAGALGEDYDAIIEGAVEAQRTWRMVPAPRRGELVLRIGQLMEENLEPLAGVIALDTGKTLPECRAELKEAIDMATLAAGQSRMLYGYSMQSQRAEHRMYDQWLPLGVVGVISAYNFPAAVWAQNGFLSAIAGNTVIWKPSPKVPLTAIAVQRLAVQAMKEFGVDGVFSLFIPGDDRIAEKLVADTRVALVSFTGSTGVGRKVANIVGATLGRRYQLECSGNSAIIVDETADLKQAVRSIAFSGVGTTGQRCTSARRVIVHKSVVGEVTELLKTTFAQVKVGHFTEADTLVGPLIDGTAIDEYHTAIAEAVSLGGKVEAGGNRIDREGYYVEPTFISGCEPQWPCVQRETFAPVVYLLTYDTIEEAIAINNDVAQGLAAGIQSTNLRNIELFLSAAGNDCGIAKVNMGTTGADVGASFGGEKETGGGRTAGSDAWKGFMRRQSVCINWSGASPWDARIKL
ncbi:aldehyde dehydrogenase family protein [Cupriavidus basilensis]|uniref:aldehyde dehydrogenase family protein n=1 Tax=Cupriavidus basilensis TaxID=68895 RepID=UPI002851D909|nr:aldehyde dehydrogenase family protein [Cupriavidus basilensis]MDR3381242.1 aldehyde dehydrogenase family protein [Cupriavidus basilensis]